MTNFVEVHDKWKTWIVNPVFFIFHDGQLFILYYTSPTTQVLGKYKNEYVFVEKREEEIK